MKRDLLSLWDLTSGEIIHIIHRARSMKEEWARNQLKKSMAGKTLGMIFVKPSTRTRVSFEAAAYRLGGNCIFMTEKDTQLSRKEPLADTARVLSRYVEILVMRTYGHDDVVELARHATIPVINGLTDSFHPCQILADLMTVEERRGSIDGLRAAWVGDGNNVAHSWINAAAILGFSLTLACPEGYDPDAGVMEKARSEGRGEIILTRYPREAAALADVISTDVWASMGQEEEAEARRQVFRPYQVGSTLLSGAPPKAIVLHCLPAHRGEEITGEVLEGPQSAVFDQAENRLHVQMALMEWMLEGSA
ncbi:MAG: ornithine carbamoyltransferase [Syntrophobacteraceae bacterium]